MQRGTILKHHGSWCSDITRPLLVMVSESEEIIQETGFGFREYPTKRSVLLLADKIWRRSTLARSIPSRAYPLRASSNSTICPTSRRNSGLQPTWTTDHFPRSLKSRIADTRLRDFEQCTPTLAARHSGVGHTSLLRIKSFLSGFSNTPSAKASSMGDPIRDVSVPGRTNDSRARSIRCQRLKNYGDCWQSG